MNNFTIVQNQKNNPVTLTNEPGKSNFSDQTPDVFLQNIEIPMFAVNPSRVVQMINVITPEDVMDDLEYREIVEDIKTVKLFFI